MSKKTKPVEFKPPTTEEQIATIQKKLNNNPDMPAREFAVLTGQLGRLTGAIRKSRQNWRDKKDEQELAQERALHPKPVAEPLCWRRSGLVELVADRLANVVDQALTPEEIQAAIAVNFTPEELLRFAKYWMWNHAHPNELRELLESFVEDHPEIDTGSWVAHLKAYPRITVNAGPTLTPGELRDVETYRSVTAAAREQKRRDLYERFPDRFLCGYKTVAEYDAAHPGASILRQLLIRPWMPDWMQQMDVRYPEMVRP